MTENRPSKTIHLRMTALTGPSAFEKLSQASRNPKFWLWQFTPRAIDRVGVNGNGRLRSVCHMLYVGANILRVKTYPS